MSLEGYKTFVGIGIALLGALGLGELISEDEAMVAVDLIAQLAGLAIAVYGRIKAKKTY